MRGTVSPITSINFIDSRLCISMLYWGLWGPPSLEPGLQHQGSRRHVVTGQGEDEGNHQWRQWCQADLPKLLQEGGTDSRLQCGSRTSLSARDVEDRNSYVSGATWRQTSSFQVFKGEEELIRTRVRYDSSVREAKEEHTSLPITLSTVKGRVRNQWP